MLTPRVTPIKRKIFLRPVPALNGGTIAVIVQYPKA